ncbi:MAG TPA: TIGR02680 family protein [Ktedonobacteraceae bacterium]|nr:TIGR02680 family protein [Ktedonobacteraceae bacterium]
MQTTFDTIANWNERIQARANQLNGQANQLVDLLQGLAGGPQGYRLRRIMLTNFWLYGQQIFEVPHGRLFLAGENASGKSTVLTAALPLGLDGDLRPNRLDTFGGRERHIEYYVLGGSESATPYNFERRTAYIALEFEWCDPDHPPIAPEIQQRWENGNRESARFLTIGVSLAGNANTTDRIRPLRFLITDGSRLGYELDTLYETGNKGEKRAYDHLRFKQQLEGHGIICDTQAEYEKQVARYLFGYHDVKDFEKLINLLLVLRRPNLSSELNFSKVHDYLKMSLRKISSETTSHVIGTIERIDAIQSEMERIQEAYDSTDHLHRTRQQLARVRAQLAACDYLSAHAAEDALQQQVNKLRRDLQRATGDRARADSTSQTLQQEQYQIQGQIKALEASEGLQVATRLATIRERLRENEAQLQLQAQSVTVARQGIQDQEKRLSRQQTRFAEEKKVALNQLRDLLTIARQEAQWEVVALQLEEAQQFLSTLSPEAGTTLTLPLVIATLNGPTTQERMVWLRSLETLHQQRERAETQVQYARTQETTRFQELDEARSQFQISRELANTAQRQLNSALAPFFSPSDAFAPSISSDDLPLLEHEDEEANDESQSSAIVERLSAAIEQYHQVLDVLDHDLVEAIDEAQSELNELQLLAGGKMQELAAVKTRYEQKLSEPEYTPPRSTRRTTARARLAEHGIQAQPLYALLDFTPDTPEDEAGRIEAALEDAGLLDALAVPAAQREAARTLLASEGLSDCFLDVAAIPRNLASSIQKITRLRFDAAGNAQFAKGADEWRSMTEHLLTVLQPYLSTDLSHNGRYSLAEDGTWTHGLLRGQVSKGSARLIGSETRQRTRQRELDALLEVQNRLEGELQQITGRIATFEEQITFLQEQRTLLRKPWQQSQLEERYAALKQAQRTMASNQEKYQKARQQTQDARQVYNTLTAQLERASQGNSMFVSSAEHVARALLATNNLQQQGQSLRNQLTSLIHQLEEGQTIRSTLAGARENETTVASLHDRIQAQVLQVQAELDELQRMASFADAAEISERLQTLRERSETLLSELESARMAYVRADERAQNFTTTLSETEIRWQAAQQESHEKQTNLLSLLSAYPDELLLRANQFVNQENYAEMVRLLLGAELRDDEIVARKDQLENGYRDAYSALVKAFTHEQSILLEYGPDLDDQGDIVFLHENRSRPIELLSLLGERIEMQKTLLEEQERQLFEDFLLQEIAEAIRTHILEAEEWVQQINQVLGGLPMIGEHYSLQWKPPAEYNMTRFGSHLAQHYRLLRKPAQSLTTEESNTLMSAFRREIESVRLRQQENPDTNFMEALEQVFDYREWFHFDVYVTPVNGGQRQRLTDRVAGTRSGAEQLFALYVPLFAALGALYKSAAPGAPRLLSLDEAFDKVSVANTQRIMEFLISQDFQWIMTGPQVSGEGTSIPASVRYLMLHEKGAPVATASPSFWSNTQDLAALPGQEE